MKYNILDNQDRLIKRYVVKSRAELVIGDALKIHFRDCIITKRVFRYGGFFNRIISCDLHCDIKLSKD